jgi:hypothetical protein
MGNRRRRVGTEPEITVSGAGHEPGPEDRYKNDHDDPVHSVLSVTSLDITVRHTCQFHDPLGLVKSDPGGDRPACHHLTALTG